MGETRGAPPTAPVGAVGGCWRGSERSVTPPSPSLALVLSASLPTGTRGASARCWRGSWRAVTSLAPLPPLWPTTAPHACPLKATGTWAGRGAVWTIGEALLRLPLPRAVGRPWRPGKQGSGMWAAWFAAGACERHSLVARSSGGGAKAGAGRCGTTDILLLLTLLLLPGLLTRLGIGAGLELVGLGLGLGVGQA